jgi:cellulose synthase/poly-beta-1,6-N-acetylglucosamine synthase-like glycosyltransferase
VVNRRQLRRPGATGIARVSVLIPARDEAGTIADCLGTLTGQEVVEVLVLDDGSSDATAEIAQSCGARVLPGTAPPPGWLGKPWACAQLAVAADPRSDVLVFLDADVRVEPGAIALAVGLLGDLDMVSPHPRQVAVTVSERLVQPLLEWSILTFLPLRLSERSPRSSLAAANGQFLVVRRAAYERAGGHVPDAVLDDLALLRAIKRSGGRGTVVDGSRLASCRMYSGWPELRDGYAKSLWSAFGSPGGAAGVLALLGVAYLAPPLAMLRGSRAGAVGYAAAVASRVVTARRTRGRALPDAFAHPVSIAVLGYLTVRSHVQHRRGTLRWKGRALVG